MSDQSTLYLLAYGGDAELAPYGGNVFSMVRLLARELYDLKYNDKEN